jgi:hypothetical protein
MIFSLFNPGELAITELAEEGWKDEGKEGERN